MTDKSQENHRRPWTAEPDDENRVAKIYDADRDVVALIQDVIRPRALETATMLANMANEQRARQAGIRRRKASKMDHTGTRCSSTRGKWMSALCFRARGAGRSSKTGPSAIVRIAGSCLRAFKHLARLS